MTDGISHIITAENRFTTRRTHKYCLRPPVLPRSWKFHYGNVVFCIADRKTSVIPTRKEISKTALTRILSCYGNRVFVYGNRILLCGSIKTRKHRLRTH